MRLAIIGDGAIGRYVFAKATEAGHEIAALILLPEFVDKRAAELDAVYCTSDANTLPNDIDHVIDCAGHAGLQSHGPTILHSGSDLTTVSLGALADANLYAQLEQAAVSAGTRLHLVSGAIGALDCLRAARTGGLQNVTYVGRKPPQSWKGSPAEARLDLDAMHDTEATHFEGSARQAASEYPKNANVAAAVALAGMGFEKTQVQLIADPNVTENIHEVRASGSFGQFYFEVRGHALPDNPRSSALAAMSVLAKLEQASQPIVF